MAQGKFGTKPGKVGATSNPMVLVMGIFFMLFSVLGGVLFYLSMSQKAAPKPAGPNTTLVKQVDVVIPLKDLKAGSELDPAFFGVEIRAETSVSSKTVRSIQNIKGKFAAFDIISGQPLMIDAVADKRPSTVIQTKIPEGYRMVTIRVDATSSVEGWARPGARVDVTWIGTQNGEPVAKIVVEAAEILSYNGGTVGPDGPNQEGEAPSTVSLLVTKDDALKIQLSQTTGRLSLSLRTDRDLDTSAEKASIGMGDVIKSSEDKGKCRDARKRGIIDQVKANGDIEKMVLDDLGRLVPLSQFCPSEGQK